MRLIVLLLTAALCCGAVHAQVPRQISYQGYLTNPGGTPVNATLQMQFSFYDDPALSGQHQLYTEIQSQVTVANGVFNVVIGSVTPLALPFNEPYYLGIAVGADSEMVPRQRLVTVPYAIRSASSEALEPTATIDGGQITGAVTAATIPGSQITGTISNATIPGTVPWVVATEAKRLPTPGIWQTASLR